MAKKPEINLDAVVGVGENVPSEDIARQFAADTTQMSSVRSPVDEFEDDDEIERLERELQGPLQAAGPVPVMDEVPTDLPGIFRALTIALREIASGSANSQTVAAKALEAASRQTQPDNKQAPMVSTLNPQGDLSYPKPKLKCAMHIPWEVENESVTWEEAELLNLLEDGNYVIRKNDGSKVRVEVKILTNLNGRPERLFMNAEMGFSQENFWQMPALSILLRQVLGQKSNTRIAASKVLTMDERAEMVRSGELAISAGAR